MKIGINLLYLLPGIVGGTETYAAGLLHGLGQISAVHQVTVFLNRESADWPLPEGTGLRRVICPVSAENRPRRYFFEQRRLPKLLKDLELDLVHSLGYVAPLRTPCPSVVTIPDSNFVSIKHTMTIQRRAFLRLFSGQSARRACHVITLSEFSKSELCRFLKIDRDKVTVTYLGPRITTNTSTPESWTCLKHLYCIREPYIVAFGSQAIHKNIPLLIRSFSMVKNEFPHSLVLIGYLPAGQKIPRDDNLMERLIPTGYVPSEHILPILDHAELLALPSLYEGFGLPVLEAQQAGTAVACSTAGSLPEVAGKGAAYFDPNSPRQLASVIRRCLSDKAYQAALRQLGTENLERFSWVKTAGVTLAVYRRVLESRPPYRPGE